MADAVAATGKNEPPQLNPLYVSAVYEPHSPALLADVSDGRTPLAVVIADDAHARRFSRRALLLVLPSGDSRCVLAVSESALREAAKAMSDARRSGGVTAGAFPGVAQRNLLAPSSVIDAGIASLSPEAHLAVVTALLSARSVEELRVLGYDLDGQGYLWLPAELTRAQGSSSTFTGGTPSQRLRVHVPSFLRAQQESFDHARLQAQAAVESGMRHGWGSNGTSSGSAGGPVLTYELNPLMRLQGGSSSSSPASIIAGPRAGASSAASAATNSALLLSGEESVLDYESAATTLQSACTYARATSRIALTYALLTVLRLVTRDTPAIHGLIAIAGLYGVRGPSFPSLLIYCLHALVTLGLAVASLALYSETTHQQPQQQGGGGGSGSSSGSSQSPAPLGTPTLVTAYETAWAQIGIPSVVGALGFCGFLASLHLLLKLRFLAASGYAVTAEVLARPDLIPAHIARRRHEAALRRAQQRRDAYVLSLGGGASAGPAFGAADAAAVGVAIDSGGYGWGGGGGVGGQQQRQEPTRPGTAVVVAGLTAPPSPVRAPAPVSVSVLPARESAISQPAYGAVLRSPDGGPGRPGSWRGGPSSGSSGGRGGPVRQGGAVTGTTGTNTVPGHGPGAAAADRRQQQHGRGDNAGATIEVAAAAGLGTSVIALF